MRLNKWLARLRPWDERRGAVSVLTAVMMVMILAIAAFAIDLGYIAVCRTELQRTADAAALAGAWELYEGRNPGSGVSATTNVANSRSEVATFAGLNQLAGQTTSVDTNAANTPTGDVVLGYVNNPFLAGAALTFPDASQFNAVKVVVRRNSAYNGEVPFFFARILGFNSNSMQAEATAAFLSDIKGFKSPPSGKRLDLLPFALDKTTWDNLMAGTGSDSWSYNPTTRAVSAGADGVKEVNLYPQGTGSPGNRGTVDIGSSNNSTADIARQIVDGISAADLEHHGGELKFGANGTLELNGDTGISAGVKDELASIIGDPRIIPVFQSVTGPGNNAQYTIVKFVGVRIMEVKLTGSNSSKRVIIQPAETLAWGVIPGDSGSSDYVFSPVVLTH